MSSETQEQTSQDQGVVAEENNEQVQTTGLDMALVDGRYVRLSVGIEPPEGSEIFLFDDLEGLKLTKLGEIYGDLAGVTAKKFRSPKIAVESIAFQLKKKTPTNPWAPKTYIKATDAAPNRTDKGEKKEKAKKEPTASTITLLAPEDLSDQLKKLAPQARDLVGILVELAAASGTTTFTGDVVSKALNEQKSVERLRTRQSPDRIFAYYRSSLIGSGIIKVA